MRETWSTFVLQGNIGISIYTYRLSLRHNFISMAVFWSYRESRFLTIGLWQSRIGYLQLKNHCSLKVKNRDYQQYLDKIWIKYTFIYPVFYDILTVSTFQVCFIQLSHRRGQGFKSPILHIHHVLWYGSSNEFKSLHKLCTQNQQHHFWSVMSEKVG